MSFSDFMTTAMIVKKKGEKDKWGDFTYTDVNIMGRLQKTQEWNVNPTSTQIVRRGRVYVMPDVEVLPGDKIEVEGEQFLVDDVSLIRDKDGVLHHLEIDV